MKIDRLTGLPTHHSVPEYLAESGGHPFGVFVDIDRLNRLNYEYGHEAGDSAIRQVASALNELSKSCGARTFRISGEEFLILLADSTSSAQAYEIAEAAVKAVADLRIKYPRGNNPAQNILTVNVAVCRLSGTFLEQIEDVRKWIAEEIWKAKKDNKGIAGVIGDCRDSLPPWAMGAEESHPTPKGVDPQIRLIFSFGQRWLEWLHQMYKCHKWVRTRGTF